MPQRQQLQVDVGSRSCGKLFRAWHSAWALGRTSAARRFGVTGCTRATRHSSSGARFSAIASGASGAELTRSIRGLRFATRGHQNCQRCGDEQRTSRATRNSQSVREVGHALG
jgi:hypothetical protein